MMRRMARSKRRTKQRGSPGWVTLGREAQISTDYLAQPEIPGTVKPSRRELERALDSIPDDFGWQSPVTEPVARIAADRSPTCAVCSMSASESLYCSRTMHSGLIVVEVNVVLQRAGVLRPHDLHGLSGQVLELLELALVKRESSDTLKLAHDSGLQTFALLAGIDAVDARASVLPDPCYPDCRPGNRPAASNDDANIGKPPHTNGPSATSGT
jgi:hypothetical protein